MLRKLQISHSFRCDAALNDAGGRKPYQPAPSQAAPDQVIFR